MGAVGTSSAVHRLGNRCVCVCECVSECVCVCVELLQLVQPTCLCVSNVHVGEPDVDESLQHLHHGIRAGRGQRPRARARACADAQDYLDVSRHIHTNTERERERESIPKIYIY